jgi:hypothetical protein
MGPTVNPTREKIRLSSTLSLSCYSCSFVPFPFSFLTSRVSDLS